MALVEERKPSIHAGPAFQVPAFLCLVRRVGSSPADQPNPIYVRDMGLTTRKLTGPHIYTNITVSQGPLLGVGGDEQ